MLTNRDLFSFEHTLAAPLLRETTYPWEVLAQIADLIRQIGPALPADRYRHPKDGIWIAESAIVADTALIDGPCIIGEETEIRQAAFIRGSVLVGDRCVIGNSVECKNAIIFDACEVPHFNYVGDSVLGYRAHLGAGAITSNIKSDRKDIVIKDGDRLWETGRRKIGAMLGDCAEVGCNCVLNPGTIIGRNTRIYPLSSVRGIIPPDCIYKSADEIVPIRKDS